LQFAIYIFYKGENMKCLFNKSALVALGFVVICHTKNVMGCMPPPDLTYVQPSEYEAVINSSEVMDKLRALGAKDIASISATREGYVLSASSHCIVSAQVEYTNNGTHGMCPTIKGVKVLDAKCP
jgi:hypothetical protein